MVPTLGASAAVLALQVCDQVSLAGFGYDMQRPQSRLHYYEALPMDAMKAQVGASRAPSSLAIQRRHPALPRLTPRPQVVHDVSAEKLFLRDLVAAGATTDLTGAL